MLCAMYSYLVHQSSRSNKCTVKNYAETYNNNNNNIINLTIVSLIVLRWKMYYIKRYFNGKKENPYKLNFVNISLQYYIHYAVRVRHAPRHFFFHNNALPTLLLLSITIRINGIFPPGTPFAAMCVFIAHYVCGFFSILRSFFNVAC